MRRVRRFVAGDAPVSVAFVLANRSDHQERRALGPKIRRAYSNMGVMAFAELDSEQLMDDEKVAQEFDARMGRRAEE
jgi:hypothetical protein